MKKSFFKILFVGAILTFFAPKTTFAQAASARFDAECIIDDNIIIRAALVIEDDIIFLVIEDDVIYRNGGIIITDIVFRNGIIDELIFVRAARINVSGEATAEQQDLLREWGQTHHVDITFNR
ncbi:MAG: hypothetical protein RL757_3237 [Bacteroidota bacterium]|jgi:hypothetical protein